MAASTTLNTILRDAAKTPLLTGERSAFVPGMTVPVCRGILRGTTKTYTSSVTVTGT